MSRKDYKTLAACFGLGYAESFRFQGKEQDIYQRAVMDIINRVSLECQLENPRFSRDKFLSEIDKVSRSRS